MIESKRVNDLRSRVGNLRQQLLVAEVALREAKIEECGLRIGDIVRNPKGVEFRVADIEPRYTFIWLTLNPRKKDGSFGQARRRDMFESGWSKVSSADGQPA